MAVMQVRDAMRNVLYEYVERQSLSADESIKILQDVFFNTSNNIYDLKLPLLPSHQVNEVSLIEKDAAPGWAQNVSYLQKLLRKDPSIQYLRLQWLDYTR